MIPPFTRASSIVPESLDATRWENLEPLYGELLARPLKCVGCLTTLIDDRSEIDAAAKEALAVLYIRMTCRTDDPAASKAYEDFIEHVQPKLKDAWFRLDQKIVSSPFVGELDKDRFGTYLRDLHAAVELFRAENIPLETELTRLGQDYARISGAMTVKFLGEERPLPRMAKFQEDTYRATREAAWRAVAERRLRDADELDGLFERMIEIRGRVARNAGFSNYRDYMFRARRRFDYGPGECDAYARAVEAVVSPAIARLVESRRTSLKISSVRPWDTHVDVRGRAPLRPFENAEELVDRTRRVFRRMDGSAGGLGSMFDALAEDRTSSGIGSMDLESRKGKAPGGYQESRERIRLPFIFMNAAGLLRDVETMVHEAGHAFHSLLLRPEPLLHYRNEIPLEFAEVASMSMELAAHPYLDEFFSPAEADRARRNHLEQLLVGLGWIAMVDQFQHWVYTTPGHTRAQRHEKWRDLLARFAPGQDYSGLEELAGRGWHRILHIFEVPFYYIEYGIAQLGALQWWRALRRDRAGALAAYRRGLSLGASKPLPDLFAASGLRFDFGEATVRELVGEVEGELAKMPA
jgi:oligoendopeptidase F